MTDICANRHGDNKQSEAAFIHGEVSRANQRGRVLGIIEDTPMTMKEIAAQLGVPFNTISGRGSELKRDGLVYETGEVRDGSAVLSISI